MSGNGWKADIDAEPCDIPNGWREEALMGWIIEAAIDWFWLGFVERMSKGKPWWVSAFWALSPILVVGVLFGALWLLFR